MDFFIELLSDHLNKRKTVVPKEVNWHELIATAKKHEMSALLYFQCKDFIPGQYRMLLEQAYASALFYYGNRNKAEQWILESFGDIRCFIVKGTALAVYYPRPWLRTMGDSDIVVDEANMEKVHEIMLQKGYRCISVGDYEKDGMEVEIHTQLAFDTTYTSQDDVKFFNSFWSYYHDNMIDWSFHFLFVMRHLRSHLIENGVGLRQFADIAVLTKYNNDLDWSWITEKLKSIGMWEFAQRVFALNYYWFQIEPPFELLEADESFLISATDQILRNGVFGYDDLDNRANRIIASRSKYPVLFMFKRSLSIIFPKYKDLSRMPQYAFLKGRRFLLPIAWIYRGFYTIEHKGMKWAKAIIGTSFTTKSAIDKRKSMFDEWGIVLKTDSNIRRAERNLNK